MTQTPVQTRLHATEHCCQICGKTFRSAEVMSAAMLHGALHDKICTQHPEWCEDGYICLDDLNRLRREYIQDNMAADNTEINAVQQQVLDSIKENESIIKNINAEFEGKQTFGNRLSDHVAEFGGSWAFIITFTAILFIWILVNSVAFLSHYDPYPFMLMNLVLSCVAALQAPVIMMSQNRQEAKDRLRAEHDFQTNLKAELEIRNLNAKVDELLTHQWHRLLEIQQIQVEMMEELVRHHEWEQTHHETTAPADTVTPSESGR